MYYAYMPSLPFLFSFEGGLATEPEIKLKFNLYDRGECRKFGHTSVPFMSLPTKGLKDAQLDSLWLLLNDMVDFLILDSRGRLRIVLGLRRNMETFDRIAPAWHVGG